MNQNLNYKKKYLIQCKFCGKLLLKSETGILFNTQTKCPKCKKILNLPEDVVVTLDKGSWKKVK